MSSSTAIDRPLRIGLLAVTVIGLTLASRGGAQANQTNLVLQNARRLKPLVTAEHIYWTNAGDARALTLSRQNQQALDQLIATASQGNADRAYNSALAFAASCSACHDNHPEQRVRIRN